MNLCLSVLVAIGGLAPDGQEGLSRPFEYVVKDASLLDPTRASAEIEVYECLGDRVGARKIVPLR